MKILVVGSGGREHAIVWKVSQSALVDKIYCAPGNGGTSKENKCENINLEEIEDLLNFAKKENIDLTIVGPEVSLVDGIVDRFKENNLKIFGPSKEASKLEGSKSFAKKFMKKYCVKTADYEVFEDVKEAVKYLENCSYPTVIKADGLAAGKGVVICKTKEEAKKAIENFMIKDVLKGSGLKIVIEEFLEGVEASILSITDGKTIIPFISSKDHKQIFDGDKGPNTGGMGVIVPNFYCTDKVLEEFNEEILKPTLKGVQEEDMDYIGTIFFGIMITKKGVYLLEYNVRMGDPETQGVLSLMDSDYLELMLKALDKELKNYDVKWKNGHICCITAVSKGYPGSYEKGFEITGLNNTDSKVFIAGAKEENEKLVSDGGRVLNVVAFGKTLDDAKKKAYKDIEKIDFDGMYYRHDIGNRKVKRIFVEKKLGFNVEAKELLKEIKENLNIKNINSLRILNRYDVAGISDDEYEKARKNIFAEPVVDFVYDEKIDINESNRVFAVEYLPGQYDQRADSAAECIQILTQNEKPEVRCAKVIIIDGNITEDEINKIKNYYINSVDSREALLEKPLTINMEWEVPKDVEVLNGFINKNEQELKDFMESLGLAMSFEDLKFCREYFKNTEKRNPTITEIKVIDTYWSDHCRHTTFETKIEDVKFEDGKYILPIKTAYKEYINSRKYVYKNREKDMCLMDIAVICMKELRKKGLLDDLEVSDEINACSIECDVDVDGKIEKYLIMFKNETHNHPTEIEPFGGAATCLGGAIRDPLSGRSYVYGAMRITGSADPRKAISDTLNGKLPQRQITIKASNGYSSYGNQIGLATGYVKEIYDEDFVAKRMEIGAVIGAVPKVNVRRERPKCGDSIILVGGKTGRDGCGGATGSSKEHDEKSILTCGAEVQKGNPPTERKLQRLFRNEKVSKIIKKCNDFGAGGVAVAIGELSDGLSINLDLVSKKYEGLDGTELAISESQERMAVLVDSNDSEKFIKMSREENLEAIEVAKVTDNKRLKMYWRGKDIVNIKREFLDTNGVKQRIDVIVKNPSNKSYFQAERCTNVKEKLIENLRDLNMCSERGLIEKFDSSIGAGTVFMPFGGKYYKTPTESMCFKVPVLNGETKTGTIMAYGYNPKIGKWSPFHGAMYSVIEAVTKVVAAGGDYRNIRLTFQEYFEKLGEDSYKWGKPFSALLGAFVAQKELGIPAIGGKDSMSGTFKDINVPPTLVAFAVDTVNTDKVISPEFKKKGSKVVLLKVSRDENDVPNFGELKKNYEVVRKLINRELILAAHTVTMGGVLDAISKMTFGNKIGMNLSQNIKKDELFSKEYGAIVLELDNRVQLKEAFKNVNYTLIGFTQGTPNIKFNDEEIHIDELIREWESPLEKVFPTKTETDKNQIPLNLYHAKSKVSPCIKIPKPQVYIPVFYGTNCEYDLKRAFKGAGAKTNLSVFRNLTPKDIENSIEDMVDNIKNSQIIMLPGGFSAGDEPDGSGKFIATVFRNPKVKEVVMEFLNKRDGLILGICNGFQVLTKLGLLPFGEIRDIDEKCPTLTYNSIGRHMSRVVKTKIVSNMSPWFNNVKLGDVHSIAVSHGEGRFVCTEEIAQKLLKNGQIATQYVDFNGNPTYDIEFNPNGSVYAVEGITSPDGRILGKMGHSERIGDNVYKNIIGEKDQKLFESGVKYFK
ncbi:phosphoribosylformylglycinamidine synthase [Clostridium botulinum]|uniref:phosphoribosylformylglycinamidine synthase n=1 Tax=Clostridium botulinum TaxID=1491 RepID=UPI0004D740F0|nr:phosphoribosylformylglycinamidine synthase [Clostridium botulinum D str. 16868]